MAENRYSTEEENMAAMMAKLLPKSDAMEMFGSFYRSAWAWSLKNTELMELFPRIAESEEAFRSCLQICRRENLPEAFALALSLRLDALRAE